jgi:uncharacterized glyoxalase superfamily protein PhnB
MAARTSAKKSAGKSAKKSAKKSLPKTKAVGKARARADAQKLKLGSVAPSLTVNDLQKSLTWYRDVAGFVVAERWENEGKLLGVELQAGTVRVMIGQDDWKKGRDRKKGEGFRLYCRTTQNVDVLAAGIVARGGKLDHAPMDQPWGEREFALTDPDGFKITIAQGR